MSERSRDDILNKIKGLLKKTEANGCSANEAEQAFRIATRLMAEHNLQMADVTLAEGDQAESYIDEPAFDVSRWTLEQNLTYGIVREFCFVECHFDRTISNGKSVKRLMIFGKPENVENARFMFQALMSAYDRLWSSYRILNRAPASDRRVYVAGVAKGFHQKMRDEREAMKIERDLTSGKTGGTAIVLASIHDKIQKAMREKNPGLKKSSGGFTEATGSRSALEAGLRDGRSLNLNRAIGGGSGRKAIA